MGLTASQIRQDFNCFGGFGQQGYGYNVEQLRNEISKILGLSNNLGTIIIGAGNLGRAIATHMSFEERGFNLIGIFDKNEALAGQMVRGIPIRHISGLDDFAGRITPQLPCYASLRNMAPRSKISWCNLASRDFGISATLISQRVIRI